MKQDDRSTHPSRKKPATAADAQPPAVSNSVMSSYMTAVQLLQQGKFEKSLVALEKLMPLAPPQIVERCRMYIATCHRQLEKQALTFATPEEHYDYAVSLLNTGYFEDAREQFNSILAIDPNADYVYYGMAVLDSITGMTQECLQNLARAIELNSSNRLQARIDNDFQNIVDDPRFTELLYPEVP
ncbi:MAG: tetratricopeptide repeat protein [Terracidiphilus sp.]|nr:tetratricopeptide repeat protein [Terracidiphilus sp.]